MRGDLKYWIARVKQDSFSLLLFVTLAGFLGLFVNQFSGDSLSLLYQPKEQRIAQAVVNLRPASVKALPIQQASLNPTTIHDDSLTLEQFRAFIAKKQGIIIDARAIIFYQESHIPGALSLPRNDFEESYKKISNLLEKDKTRPLAVYCSSGACVDSDLVQRGLILLGYTNVFRFNGGWDEWKKAHLPEEHSIKSIDDN